MRLIAAAHSDVGLRREANEDSFAVRPDLGLYAIADGMGGHAAGEVASRLAIEAIEATIADTASEGREATLPGVYNPAVGAAGSRLTLALQRANQEIGRQSELRADAQGMATTSVVLLVPPPHAGAPAADDETLRGVVAHVGDSRIYLWRDGLLDRLTRDHSWVEEQVEAGALSTTEARQHPWRNLVTRALAGGPDPIVDLLPVSLELHDRLLLCSDGLTSVVADEEIGDVMGRPRDGDLEGLCRALVAAANAAGGPDNITVIVVEVV